MVTKRPASALRKAPEMQLKQKTRAQFNLLTAVFEASPDMILILDPQANILNVNENAILRLKHRKEELLNQKLNRFMGKKSIENDEISYLESDTFDVPPYTEFRWVARCGDAEEFPVEVRMKRLPKGLMIGDSVADVLLTVRDISCRRAFEERMYHLAHYDVVTGLINRSLLEDRAKQSLARCARNGHKMAFLFLDLDHFKEVNDTLGHSIGDRLLKAVGMRIQASLRKNDTLGRLGGDEFLVLAEDIQYADDARLIGEKIISNITDPFSIDGHVVHVGTSIGISLYPDQGTDYCELLDIADKAMYCAKETGPNKLAVFNTNLRAV